MSGVDGRILNYDLLHPEHMLGDPAVLDVQARIEELRVQQEEQQRQGKVSTTSIRDLCDDMQLQFPEYDERPVPKPYALLQPEHMQKQQQPQLPFKQYRWTANDAMTTRKDWFIGIEYMDGVNRPQHALILCNFSGNQKRSTEGFQIAVRPRELGGFVYTTVDRHVHVFVRARSEHKLSSASPVQRKAAQQLAFFCGIKMGQNKLRNYLMLPKLCDVDVWVFYDPISVQSVRLAWYEYAVNNQRRIIRSPWDEDVGFRRINYQHGPPARPKMWDGQTSSRAARAQTASAARTVKPSVVKNNATKKDRDHDHGSGGNISNHVSRKRHKTENVEQKHDDADYSDSHVVVKQEQDPAVPESTPKPTTSNGAEDVPFATASSYTVKKEEVDDQDLSTQQPHLFTSIPEISQPLLHLRDDTAASQQVKLVNRTGRCSSCGVARPQHWRTCRDGVQRCNACALRFQRFGIICTACQYVPQQQEVCSPNARCTSCHQTGTFTPKRKHTANHHDTKKKQKKEAVASTTLDMAMTAFISPSIAQRPRLNDGSMSTFYCASCNTSNTPFWRAGRSDTRLCNACGIRFRKHQVMCSTCNYVPHQYETVSVPSPACVRCETQQQNNNNNNLEVVAATTPPSARPTLGVALPSTPTTTTTITTAASALDGLGCDSTYELKCDDRSDDVLTKDDLTTRPMTEQMYAVEEPTYTTTPVHTHFMDDLSWHPLEQEQHLQLAATPISPRSVLV